jgi:hypothetical protein
MRGHWAGGMTVVAAAGPTGRIIREAAAVERWLDALRLAWGNAYAICFDEDADPAWMAWPIGDHATALTGRTPEELNAAIRGHWACGEML